MHDLVRDGKIRLTDEEAGGRYECESLDVPLGSSQGWEAAVLDHFQAMTAAISQKLTRGPAASRGPEVVGGSTWSLDISDGHPLAAQAKDTLMRIRRELEELRQQIDCECATSGFVQADEGRWFRPEEGSVGASCQGGLCRTHVETRACGDTLTCGPGELCLVFDTVTGPTQTVEFRCVANPCGGVAADCTCAARLCDIGNGHSRLCLAGTNTVEELSCQDQAQ